MRFKGQKFPQKRFLFHYLGMHRKGLLGMKNFFNRAHKIFYEQCGNLNTNYISVCILCLWSSLCLLSSQKVKMFTLVSRVSEISLSFFCFLFVLRSKTDKQKIFNKRMSVLLINLMYFFQANSTKKKQRLNLLKTSGYKRK